MDMMGTTLTNEEQTSPYPISPSDDNLERFAVPPKTFISGKNSDSTSLIGARQSISAPSSPATKSKTVAAAGVLKPTAGEMEWRGEGGEVVRAGEGVRAATPDSRRNSRNGLNSTAQRRNSSTPQRHNISTPRGTAETARGNNNDNNGSNNKALSGTPGTRTQGTRASTPRGTRLETRVEDQRHGKSSPVVKEFSFITRKV